MNKQDRIYNELIHEEAGIWHVSDEYGSKVMVKAPMTSNKALIQGCRLQLVFGKDQIGDPNIFHTGLKIFDDPTNFLIIVRTHRFPDEHLSIAKIWNLDKVQIQLINELNICIAFGDLIVKEQDKHEILSLLGNPKKLYTGQFDSTIEKSLDCFQNSLRNISPLPARSIHIIDAKAEILNVGLIKNCFYPDESTVVSTHVKGEEGEELEKEVFAVLSSLFKKSTIKNPRIPYKANMRELTDVLAFSEFGIFLIETKALSVIDAKADRTMERKVTGLKKQISKAINQLVGAMKKLTEGTLVYDSGGNEIQFNKKLVPHGIILISELLSFGVWDEITAAMLKAMIESNSMIHLMDMKEFMQFIGHSQGDKNKFDHFLVQRATNFAAHPALFIETKFIKLNEKIDRF